MTYHEKYNSFYQTAEWKALRSLVFAEANGLCQHCLDKGIVRQGKEIHHIVPIEEDWSKRYEINNLVCLCRDCHRLSHERGSPLQEFNKFWEGLK